MHSYDKDPIYQAGITEAFNSGVTAASTLLVEKAQAIMGDGGAPENIPFCTLADLDAATLALVKLVPTVPDAYAAWAASGAPDGAP